tara:strand:+ start:1721 stop:2785 length:1065 start_codon:yes stop_codon:yes gene_type:complete
MYNIISPINSLGYGIAGLNIAKELDKISPVSLWPIGQPSVASKSDYEAVSDMIKNSRVPDFDADCIRIWHQHDMSQFVGRGKRVGFPIFELDTFNDVERHHLNSLDVILVCSSWARDVILDQTEIKEENVHVVPLGVDSDIFSPVEKNNHEKTIFFNCGKWEVRKGHDVIVEAFNRAFSADDDVELWMMCENPFYSEEEEKKWVDLYKTSVLGDKIKLIGRVESHQEVYNIMAKSDCGVFPARAEGWNLELLEMMSCNKPVIATNYSAHTEFCDDKNCMLVDIKDMEMAYDGKWFDGKTGKWASLDEPQINQLAGYMSKVHTDQIKDNPNGVNTAKKFTWEYSACKIIEALRNV